MLAHASGKEKICLKNIQDWFVFKNLSFKHPDLCFIPWAGLCVNMSRKTCLKKLTCQKFWHLLFLVVTLWIQPTVGADLASWTLCKVSVITYHVGNNIFAEKQDRIEVRAGEKPGLLMCSRGSVCSSGNMCSSRSMQHAAAATYAAADELPGEADRMATSR